MEQGSFKWPGIQDGVMRLSAAQLGALLEGLDWRRVHGGRRPQAPQIAG
ncbi:IS66 family insertion sequence element accessory protein TnpB [Novosphingobium sp. Chol11]